MTLTIEGTLAQRQRTYGDYKDVARTAQDLKILMRTRGNWHDISGYATLVVKELEHE